MEIHAPYGTIKYTRDAAGNITQQEIEGGGGIVYRDSRSYDELNRLLNITSATRSQSFSYDNDDNLASSTDGRNNKTAMTWDDLQRLSSVTDAKNGVSKYSYENAQSIENPSSIADAKSNSTSYKYNGLGALLSLVSPDSGSHRAAYDANGNLLEQADARGNLITYTYDAINRPTTITYNADPGLNTTFNYDAPDNKGYLRFVENSYTKNYYSHNDVGNLTSLEQYIKEYYVYLNLYYSYDKANNLTQIKYSGTGSSNVVNYTYTNGQLDGVSLNGKSIAKITHLPFGPINKIVYSNGVTEDLSYNTDYSLKQQSLSNGLLDHEYSY